MSRIMEEYINLVEENKAILPLEVYEVATNIAKLPNEDLVPDENDRKKYFIDGYEELSQAIFNFLHSRRGPYIINYTHEYKVNRLSAGFKKIEELVHFSVWIIEKYNNDRQASIARYKELADKDKALNKEQILKNIVASEHLMNEIKDLTFNMKDHNDFTRRNALIELRKEYETFAENIITSQAYYKQIDSIYIAINSINNVHELNKVPEPVEQDFLESSRV